MKKYFKWSSLILVALALSLFITRSETSYNASPCLYTEVCQEKTLGTEKTRKYGFPATYKQVTEFSPQDSSKYGLVDQGGGISQGLVIVNILFWLAAIATLSRIAVKVRNRK